MSETPEPEAQPSEAAVSWQRRFMTDWLPRAALESFLIVLSLLGALWLNDWNADNQRDQRVAEARRFILEEVRANQAQLASDSQYPHHRRLGLALKAFADLPHPTTADQDAVLEEVFATGVHPTSFRDAVWRSVSAGDLLPYMKPQEVFALAQLYRHQDDLADINKAMYSLLVTADADTNDPREARKLSQSLRLYMSDVVGLEEQLAGDYASTLKEMGVAPEPKPAQPRR